jgi:hypothetical protein
MTWKYELIKQEFDEFQHYRMFEVYSDGSMARLDECDWTFHDANDAIETLEMMIKDIKNDTRN